MPTMLDIPKDSKKIRSRIRSYERKLRKEKRDYGEYQDGAGKRLFLAPLYMVMGDQDGALESFRWYEREFPGDGGDPMQCLCWSLCLNRAGETEAAKKKLRQTMLENLYIIPLLLGEDYERIEMWHGSNTHEPPWAEMTSPEFLARVRSHHVTERRASERTRERLSRRCRACGKPLEGPTTARRRFCGPTCRKRANRERKDRTARLTRAGHGRALERSAGSTCPVGGPMPRKSTTPPGPRARVT